MRVKSSEVIISLNDSEAGHIAYRISTSLLHSIESHYNHLQQNQDGEDLFFQQEADDLCILKVMYGIVGHLDTYDSWLQRYRNMFQERRSEREKETDPA